MSSLTENTTVEVFAQESSNDACSLLKKRLSKALLLSSVEVLFTTGAPIEIKSDKEELWQTLARELLADRGWIYGQPVKVVNLKQLASLIKIIKTPFFLIKESAPIINVYYPKPKHGGGALNLYFDISALSLPYDSISEFLSTSIRFYTPKDELDYEFTPEIQDCMILNFHERLRQQNKHMLLNHDQYHFDQASLYIATVIEEGKGVSEFNPIIVNEHNQIYEYLMQIGFENVRQSLVKFTPYPLDKMEVVLSNTNNSGVLFFQYQPRLYQE